MSYLLTFLRLSLLLILLYLLFVFTELQKLDDLAAGWQLDHQPLPASPATQIPFSGINVELQQYDSAQRQVVLARLKENGFGWGRQRLDWGQLEPVQGEFAWQESDAILQAIHESGLVPVIVLDGSPAWAREAKDRTPNNNPTAPPAHPATFAKFATAFAQRYSHQLRYYQIWDEPNIAPHWGNRHIEPVAYGQLLKVASQAIRQADPDAVIIAAALAPTQDQGHLAIDEVTFLQRLYATGAAPYFDVLALQPIGFNYHPQDSRQQRTILNFQRVAWVRRAMLAAGDSATPIWAVRYGWNRQMDSPWGTVSPELQAEFATTALTTAQAQWPWLTAAAWASYQPDALPDDPLWGFALTDMTGNPQPISDALTAWEQIEPLNKNDWTRTSADENGFKNHPRSSAFIRVLNFFDNSYIQPHYLGYLLILFTMWRIFVLAKDIFVTRDITRDLREVAQTNSVDQIISRHLPKVKPQVFGKERKISWQAYTHLYQHLHPLWYILGWLTLITLYYFATWPPLILLCYLIAATWIAAQPLTGLILAALFLPFHFHAKELQIINTLWTIPPTQAALLCTLPTLYHHFRNHPIILSSPHLIILSSYHLIINLLPAFHIWHWPGYLKGLNELVLIPLLFYLSIRVLVRTQQQRHTLLLALVAGGVLVAGVGWWKWFQGAGVAVDNINRLVGPHYSPNHTALYLLRTLFLLIGLQLSTRYNSQFTIHNSPFIILLFSALCMTASRGALLLGLPTGLLLLLWSLKKKIGRGREQTRAEQYPRSSAFTRVLILLISVLLMCALSIIFFTQYGTRLANSETLFRRVEIWQTTLRLIWDNPLGVGTGGFYWHYPAYLSPLSLDTLEANLRHPHNLWLEFGATTGWLGLLWLCSWLVWLYYAIRRLWQQSPRPWLELGMASGLVAGLAHAQVDGFMALTDLAGWFWVVMGLWERRDGAQTSADENGV